MDATKRWAEHLAAWAIPDEILAAAPESPWGLPVGLFDRRAHEARSLDTPTRARCLEALQDGGSVLDVGCGAGAAGLALVPPAARVIGVDESAEMLVAFARRAESLGVEHGEIQGWWPEVGGEAEAHDVVVCAHVLYNIQAIEGFVRALTDHARRRVVVELHERHPLVMLRPYWPLFHPGERPAGPTADDALAAIRAIGIDARVERWEGPSAFIDATYDEVVPLFRRLLCLPASRDPDLRAAMDAEPLPPTRSVATIWWDP